MSNSFNFKFNYRLNTEKISFVIEAAGFARDKGLIKSETTMQNSSSYSHTSHSKVRANQRGFTQDVIDAVWQFADRETQRPGGCFELSISSGQAALLVRKGAMNAQLAGKCAKAKLLTDGTTLITVYKNDN